MQALDAYVELDRVSVQAWESPIGWHINQWKIDKSTLTYELLFISNLGHCYMYLTRQHGVTLPRLDIIEFSYQGRLYNSDKNHLKQLLQNWMLWGWNENSTLLRAVKWGALFFGALDAETALLANRGLHIDPPGLIVCHNTHKDAIDSIIDEGGLKLKYSKSGKGIWTRPPSYGSIENTRFRGDISLFVYADGLALQSANSWAVILNEDVPIGRVLRVVDLNSKEDA